MWNSISSFYIRYEVTAKVSITGYDDKNWEIQICPLCKTLYCDDLATLIACETSAKLGPHFTAGKQIAHLEEILSLTLTFLFLRLCVKRKQSFVLLFLEKLLFSHETTSPFIIHFEHQCFWCAKNYSETFRKEKLRGNTFTFQRTCLIW